MKFVGFVMYDAAKAAEVAQASDKAAETPGRKVLAGYVCEGLVFPGQPPNTMVSISIVEYESNEAMATAMYPMGLAGATVWVVPVLEVTSGRGVATEKQYRK